MKTPESNKSDGKRPMLSEPVSQELSLLTQCVLCEKVGEIWERTSDDERSASFEGPRSHS